MPNMRARRELHALIRTSLRILATEAAMEAADDAGLLSQYAAALRSVEAVAAEAHSGLIHDLTAHRAAVEGLHEEFEINLD